MRNYTTNQTPIAFKIDEDDFLAVPSIPGEEMLALVAKMKNLTEEDELQALYTFLDLVLLPESAELFATRMRSKEHPIDLATAIAVVDDLTAEYTNRPTGASSPSANGSVSGAVGSTGGASPTSGVIPQS